MIPKVSIIILDYLKSRRVEKNVESIYAQKTEVPFEVIIVDNSCDPRNAQKLESIRQKYPDTKIIINEKNEGYVQGNNKGVAASAGEYLFIVNPDIVWRDPNTLQKLVDYMETHPSVGVLGPKQFNEGDGRVAMTVRAFPSLFLQVARRTDLRRLPYIRDRVAYDEMRHLDYTKTQPVDWLQSSFWVTRRSLWEKVGGLDTRYRIFMSDPDYCWKCWQAGLQVVFFPEVTLGADGVRCSEGGIQVFFKSWILRQHVKDAVKYQMKYFLKGDPRKK